MVGTVWSYGPSIETAAVTVGGGSGVPKTYITNSATGFALTLPAATGTGHAYRFVIGVTVTSGSMTIACAGTDEFAGVIYQVDTDTTDTVAAYPALAADNFDVITLNGSTTGGLAGDWFEVVDVASGVWALMGYSNGTGTVATPLSST
jgi:hypothetical protein